MASVTSSEGCQSILLPEVNISRPRLLNDCDVIFISPSTPNDLESLDLFDALIGLWFPGMLSVFGIIGNALSLWVLSRDRVRSATMTSLKALAVSDLVLLVGALCQQIFPLSCDFTGLTRSWLCLRRGYIQVYAWPIVCAAQMASVWLTVLISTERFLAVCAPLSSFSRDDRRATTVATVRSALVGHGRVCFAVSIIVIASIAFNMPRFFEFQPTLIRMHAKDDDDDYLAESHHQHQPSTLQRPETTSFTGNPPTPKSQEVTRVVDRKSNETFGEDDVVTTTALATKATLWSTTEQAESPIDDSLTMVVLGDTDMRLDYVYLYVYNTAFYCLVVYAVPLLVVCLFNVRLVQTLAHCRRVWNALNSNVKRELRATRLPLVIVLVFTVCSTVSLLGFIFDAVFAQAGHQPRWLQIYTAISNLLVILNSAVNFLLMLCFGNKFRRMLKDAIRCRPTTSSRSRRKLTRSVMSISMRESLL